MSKHIVKCKKCNQEFDLNSIQGVKVSATRYGHATCYPDIQTFVPMEASQKSSENQDLTALKNYIGNIYKDKANWVLITKQIKDYVKKGYTYTGMLSTLKYFYEVLHNTIEKSNGGIGIIDYVWNDAKVYYYKIWLAQQKSESAAFTQDIQEIIITLPVRKQKIKLMDMDWEEEENNE